MPDAPVVVAPVAPPVKSGWRTTELYLALLALGALVWVMHSVIAMLPGILANPALPPWVAMVGPIAVTGLGWLATRVAASYGEIRTQLKLGPVAPDTITTVAQAEAVQKAP